MWVSLKIGTHKSRKGWLTREWVAKYNRETWSNIKMWVRGTPKTQEDFRRKWSFLTRFYKNPSWPLKDKNWKPTRLALAANAWWEPVPTSSEATERLARKWNILLNKAKRMKEKSKL